MARTTRRAAAPPEPSKRWFRAEEGEVHKVVFDYVANVERQQFDIFNRFVQLEALYDPNTPNSPGVVETSDAVGLTIENVIASNVDTVTAAIAATDVRPRFMTDDGDWSTQRTARRLEWYAEGLGKLLNVNAACQTAFKEAAKKGTGLVKVYVDGFGEVRVEHVRVDDIIVDEAECRNGGKPRQMHQRLANVDREQLKSMFPEHEEAIDRAQTGRNWSRMWAGYRPIAEDEIVAIESWKLPIGRKSKKGYIAGRHTITIDGCDLLDEPYDKPEFPVVAIVWSARTAGFYGISLSERIAGIQRSLNKMNWQVDRNLDHYAVPVTFVDMADASLAVQQISRIGTVVVTKGARPTTQIPPANSPEVYTHLDRRKSAAFEESGVARMSATGTKPAGLDSGVALREYRDQTTQRFSMQEKAFEQLVLDVYVHIIDCCKDLGEDAPVVTRKAKFGAKKIKWADVDMKDVKWQIAAASTLSRTPAGRYQTALEWAQAGVITTDEWRKLTQHPDLDHILSEYTQGMESVEADIEAIEDGHVVMPEPFGNLLLMTRTGQMAYLRDRDLQAPEEILEDLRQYTVQASYMLQGATPANSNEMPAGDPGAEMPPMPGEPAVAAPPTAALASQAMQLRAS
jgi:hypothetical protein